MVITFLLGIIFTLIGVVRIMASKGVAIRLIRALEAWHCLRHQEPAAPKAPKAPKPAVDDRALSMVRELKLIGFKGPGEAERLYSQACDAVGSTASNDDLIREAVRIHGRTVKGSAPLAA